MYRDEIILTVLACGNEEESYVDKAEILIRSLRGDIEKLEYEYEQLMKTNTKLEDVKLYRFVLSSLRWLITSTERRRCLWKYICQFICTN